MSLRFAALLQHLQQAFTDRARVPIEELVSRPASPVQKKSCGGYFYSGEELVSRTTRAAKP